MLCLTGKCLLFSAPEARAEETSMTYPFLLYLTLRPIRLVLLWEPSCFKAPGLLLGPNGSKAVVLVFKVKACILAVDTRADFVPGKKNTVLGWRSGAFPIQWCAPLHQCSNLHTEAGTKGAHACWVKLTSSRRPAESCHVAPGSFLPTFIDHGSAEAATVPRLLPAVMLMERVIS